ncbi:MAG: hypothetical protein IPM95_11625 [Sphingobacteriales bacterium]|nr:hypothetical protein [Sphingobacteriales bacterium]
MKKYFLFCLSLLLAILTKAEKFDLWGVNVSEPHPEISNCKVQELSDNAIFSEVKISAYSYTFATDKGLEEYSCYYGDESACFSKATEIITGKFGAPLDVYVYDEGITNTVRPAFFNIWKYDKDDQHYVLLLFGSGEGMTLDVNHYFSERLSKAFILSTVRSFHFSIRPKLLFYLEK